MAFSGSAGFIDTLRFGSYLVQSRCTIYSGGVSTQVILPISVANITIDRNSAQRRSGTITAELVPTIPPEAIFPTGPSSLLAPFGNEIFVESGITDPTGNTTYVPLGLFAIATTTIDDTTTDLVVTLNLYDRSWVISQRKLLAPYNFPATASGNFVAEIEALLNQVWTQDASAPPLQYNIVPTTAVVPVASYNQGSDPWQAALTMATACGYELFFNAQGVVTGYPIPDPATQPIVWNFTDNPVSIFGLPGTGSAALNGDPYSTPISIQSMMTREQIYNNVVIQGTGTQNATGAAGSSTAPVLASAADTNPSSSTYIGGGMGNVPEFVSTNLVTASPQAQEMANSDLAVALSAAWQIDISGPPNPIFDVDDKVTVTRPRMGLFEVPMVIDTITHVVSYQNAVQVSGRVVPS